ncbi:Zinc-metallopeptidase, peroxisomal [Acorus calamus]|uniref:Zinc-metallopeptidase, peroxisomal n=1 Tax=Acorus calamus TaxID=4465 RepID=A0AAV9EJ17_ACOCL|nr:Zinc-metallopeptidase, peroxisomal [Acorus calamus]
MAAGKVDAEIFKARSDKREYRRIVLPNSLEVLLISDSDTDKLLFLTSPVYAAASMHVSVGSFSDPEGLEGLAHFLEHMLFYASEKYPEEDSYSKYITEHGGSTNAFTESESTNYYFDINTDCFEEALDRFAQFFIKPLMSPDATSREIKAVDSENQKNLLSDAWRMPQLRQHLSCNKHPYHKFGTGNWDTLEVIPRVKGIDTRLELLKFYEENYSANQMHLVVYGKESLDELQRLVEHKFRDIRDTGRSLIHFTGQPCTSEHLQILVKAVPIKQGHKLRIMWPITPEILHYKEGPCMYLGHLIGHEGEGSLFFALKKLGWATSLVAGESDWSNEFSFFSVTIKLTDAGQEHIEDIIGLVFRYILLLQQSGIHKWIFDELVAICETGFHYKDKIQPISYVVHIALNMHLYPVEDWLVAKSLPSNFSPSNIQMILDELTPNNVRIFWESTKFEGCTELVEPWYRTSYSLEKISPSLIQRWREAAPDVSLHLPAPNVFIPTDLTIKDFHDKVNFPLLLRKTSFSRLWYKSDIKFFTPKAYVKIDFNCPHSNQSPEAEVLTDIFTRLLMDYLNECAYDAQVAGLYHGIHHTATGFQVTVVGYNHKMRLLLDTIIGMIMHFEIKADRFDVIKETVTEEYQNFKFEQPYQQAMYYCSLILKDHSWPRIEELEVLPHLRAGDLAKFFPVMLANAFLECYVAGNMQSKEAESIVNHIEDVLFHGSQPMCKPLFPSQHLTNRIIKLERGLGYLYPVACLNERDENSSLVHYIQVHQDDIKMNVKLQLFALIAKQPAFHQLRSVEQLGYITALTQRNDSGIWGLQFIIQSSVKDPVHLHDRVEAFLKMFESKLYEMSSKEYKSNVTALIDMKLEKHKNLREESSFYWREIMDGTLRFDRKESEVAALRELPQQELIDFFNEHIKVGAPHRKTLTIQVFGKLHSAEYNDVILEKGESQSTRIKDIFTFRRSRPLYGSFKGGVGHMKL